MNENNQNYYDDDEFLQPPTRQKRPKKKFHFSLFKIVVIVLLVISLACNGVLMYMVFFNTSTTSSSSSSGSTVQEVNYDVTSDLTEIVAKAQESTVGVLTYENDTSSGSGSGVIYKVDGSTVYVITNHHVIEDASKIEVVYSNGEYITAELVGSDEYGDIAVLKMTVDFEVEAFDIGDSSLLEAGETVLAIGSPLGIEYAGTVTQGIVSSPLRTISVDLNSDGSYDWDMNVIQTDAAINPGNSGGALINAVGELVGITSMKYSSEDVEGMGFALPINDVVELADEIMETGKVSRPVLGISGISLSDYSSYELYMYRITADVSQGIYIASVQSGSAAENAGLQTGDVITAFDGTEITSYKDFLTMLYAKDPGDHITLTINRDGNSMSVSVTLG
ncbi:MAG: trypsin-like peptidase domain-containing protein [Erysipelotrichaceae bacterium]|nr:trypsin-like peptidase domain-containing protein [Erysipelotrichaceae bacterium]